MSTLGLPALGLGCAPGPGEQPGGLAAALALASDLGCRLFDTAEAYGSERLVGSMLASRRDGAAMVVSKVWQTNHAPHHLRRACERSLHRLGVDRVDLYLVHAPEAWAYQGDLEIPWGIDREELERRLVPKLPGGEVARADTPMLDTWSAMLKLVEDGLVGDVGLANVGVEELEALAAAGARQPAAVQVEIHPARPQDELVAYCHARGIAVMAHSAFDRGAALRLPGLAALASRCGSSPAALLVRWHRWRHSTPILGSRAAAHLRENLAAATGPPLDQETAAELGALARAAGEPRWSPTPAR